jgi:eRF1 domain 1
VHEKLILECIAFTHQIAIAMRLIKESIERDGSGFVTLYPEDPEDMVCTSIQFSPNKSFVPDCWIPVDEFDSGQHIISSAPMIFSEHQLCGV